MIERIVNIEKLAAALGDDRFYDFHDAEIVAVKFDRREAVTCQVTLQIHRRAGEFEADGKAYDRRKNFEATFRFSGVRLWHLNGFGHQNVIEELIIERDADQYIVHFKEIFGCDLKFECEKMEFVGVDVFETEKAKYVPDFKKIKAATAAAQKVKTQKVEELLKKTRVEIAPETFSLVALSNEDWLKLLENPELSPRMTAPFMIFKDRWQVTLLLDETDLETMRVGLREARIERGFRLMSFAVELDFTVVGFLAFVSQKLAEAGISIVALGAFSRDHLLVKQQDLANALKVLGEFVEELC